MANETGTVVVKDPKIEAIMKMAPKGYSPRVYYDLVKNTVLGVDSQGKERSIEHLMLFMYVAKRTGLDPLARQIYAVFRWDSRQGKEVMTIQAGIDGLRAIAQRTGEYAGSDDAVFVEKEDRPLKASVTVYKINKKTGERMPVTASARWGEYVQVGKEGKAMGLWAKMPYNQLAKCAEALALRKGFPNELGGIYSADEMGQADNGSVLGELPQPTKPAMTATNNGKITKSEKQVVEHIEKHGAHPGDVIPVENPSDVRSAVVQASMVKDPAEVRGAMLKERGQL